MLAGNPTDAPSSGRGAAVVASAEELAVPSVLVVDFVVCVERGMQEIIT
jgi:hypothetical protein